MQWKVQPPGLLRTLFPGTTWRLPSGNNTLYLTFDDGPVEKETTWVMDLLDQYDIKASFFCVGENAHRHPDLINALTAKGHTIGNHTYNHLPARKCSRKAYFENIELAAQHVNTRLFRPPHGQLYPWYIPALRQQFDSIVMWDVLSMDYDQRLTHQQVLENVVNHVRDGSILVFHDSKKAWRNLQSALPASIEHCLKNNYRFAVLPNSSDPALREKQNR